MMKFLLFKTLKLEITLTSLTALTSSLSESFGLTSFIPLFVLEGLP